MKAVRAISEARLYCSLAQSHCGYRRRHCCVKMTAYNSAEPKKLSKPGCMWFILKQHLLLHTFSFGECFAPRLFRKLGLKDVDFLRICRCEITLTDWDIHSSSGACVACPQPLTFKHRSTENKVMTELNRYAVDHLVPVVHCTTLR